MLLLLRCSCVDDLMLCVQAETNKSGRLVLTLPNDCRIYQDYYDKRQDQIKTTSVLDEVTTSVHGCILLSLSVALWFDRNVE